MTDFKEIRELFSVWDDSFGIPDIEIIQCENRLGRKLPRMLRNYYLQLGNNKKINQTQDRLLLPENLYLEDDIFLPFYRENQGNWDATIKIEDFNMENPNVYFDCDEENVAGKLSDFLYGMALLQGIFAYSFTALANEIDLKTEATINANWKVKMFFRTPSFHITFFQNSADEIICLFKSGEYTDLAVAGKNRESFAFVVEILNLIWDYNSLED